MLLFLPEMEEAPAPKIDWVFLHENRARLQAERWKGLPDLKKNFYFEDFDVRNMSNAEVEQMR